MRILGYILVMVGFIAANVPHHLPGGIINEMATHEFERLPRQDTYSRDDMLKGMQQTAQDIWDGYLSQIMPPPLLPCVLMVIGMVLIDFGARRRAVGRLKIVNEESN